MPGFWISLPVFLPVLAGAFLLARPARSRKIRQIFAMSAVLLASVLSFCALFLCSGKAATLLVFSEKISLSFSVDGLGKVFGALVSVLWPITTLYAFSYMKHEGMENKFYGFFIMSFGVVLGIAYAGNFFTLYLFYELLTLATLPAVMHKMDDKARYAGKKYMIYSLSGAAAVFVSFVFLLQYTTTLDFTFGGTLLESAKTGDSFLLNFVFLLGFFGFGVKAAIFPLHGWLPTASVAPTPVSALLHAVAVVNAGAFAVIRLIYYCFGTDFLAGTFAQNVAICASTVTIVYGSFMALRTPHLKRRLAYSTISNLSYILLAATLMTPAGLVGGLTQMMFHSVIKITLFFCAGAVLVQSGQEYVDELQGFGKLMPVTMAAFTASAFMLMGLPPFGGFLGKWKIGTAAASLAAGNPWGYVGTGALVFSAFFTVLYVMGIVVRAYFPVSGAKSMQNASVRDPDWMMRVPMVLLVALGVVLAFGFGPVCSFFEQIAAGLV